MELDQFVQKTLTQILTGVKSAQDRSDYGEINPPLNGDYSQRLFKNVQFDVAVTVEDEIDHSAGAKIKVWSSSVGVGVFGKKKSETVSRISFEVPIQYSKGKEND